MYWWVVTINLSGWGWGCYSLCVGAGLAVTKGAERDGLAAAIVAA